MEIEERKRFAFFSNGIKPETAKICQDAKNQALVQAPHVIYPGEVIL